MSDTARAYPHPHVNDAWLARLREDILEPDLPIIDALIAVGVKPEKINVSEQWGSYLIGKRVSQANVPAGVRRWAR